MQVYVVTLVHTACRVAQGHIAQAIGIAPEEIAPAKFSPWLAAASLGLTWSELALMGRCSKANPGIALYKPHWQEGAFAWTTLERLQGEPRTGRRRKRCFCQSRKQ